MNPNLGLSPSDWTVEETTTDPGEIGARETRFTMGNGYLGSRGAVVESRRGSWPGTYIAGVFDQRDATVIDLVNAPDWLATRLHVDGRQLDLDSCQVVSHHQTLDLRRAVLIRSTVFADDLGRQTRLDTTRFVSADNQHLVAIRIQVTPIDHSSHIEIETGIDGDTDNLDRTPYSDLDRFDITERWQKWSRSKHTSHVESGATATSAFLEVATFDHDIRIGYSMAVDVPDGATTTGRSGHETASVKISFEADAGSTYTIDKFVAIATSRDHDPTAEALRARSARFATGAAASGFESVLDRHCSAWAHRWDACDCVIEGDIDATRAIRFNIYQLLIAANPHDPTVSIGAKSLSGEGYKGHVFWDTEIFILPFFTYTQPETARALLSYRYETLDGARENALDTGYRGARYPWESADTGAETTPKWTHDGLHRIWTGEEEIHITADVVYAMDTYVQATGDREFMDSKGIDIAVEAARFWLSRMEHNPTNDRYELTSVIGPDEFHEHVDNNHFTNVFARWTLLRAAELVANYEATSPAIVDRLKATLGLQNDEVANWRAMADQVYVPAISADGVIEQFQGYLALDDVPIIEWDDNNMPVYPTGYDHFNCGETTLIKQPDVLMLMYLLPDLFTPEQTKANWAFYEARTMHKSSLSPAIHAIMGIEAEDSDKAVQYFRRSAMVDLVDNQGNTRDGIHIASAGGTWMSAVAGFGGFRVRQGQPAFDPWLPPEWSAIQFKLDWQGARLGVRVTHDEIQLAWPDAAAALSVQIAGVVHEIAPGATESFSYGVASSSQIGAAR